MFLTQEMCDKAIVENAGTLNFVLNYYKNQKMCNKAIDTYIPAIQFVPD